MTEQLCKMNIVSACTCQRACPEDSDVLLTALFRSAVATGPVLLSKFLDEHEEFLWSPCLPYPVTLTVSEP